MISIPWFIAGLAVAALGGYVIGKRSRSRDVSAPEAQGSFVETVREEPVLADSRLELQREAYMQELVQTVNHIRHDWMNDMQVLSGYIQLKKYDYLPPYMEKIRLKLQNESVLGKLGAPSLVAYLLTFRTECRAFELELEFPQEVNVAGLALEEGSVERIVRLVLSAFRRHSRDYFGEPNVLTIEFAREEDGLLLDFAYNGQYDAEALEQELREEHLVTAVSGLYIEAFELGDGIVSLAIRLPCLEPITES